AGEFPEEQPLNRELDGNSVEHNLYSVMVYAENIFNARLFKRECSGYWPSYSLTGGLSPSYL
ncbi:hypothetical protein P3S20_13730, partial [Enterobacter hormaechei]|uniref:hypothetical protein n=1 Tax=Enterobacter hormaechei TaxID=158836 RepID=UPI0023E3E538